MKKLIFTILMFLTLSVNAQDYIVKFLGIPVDGTEREMINKLRKKGFEYDAYLDRLEGRFNGRDVNLYIVTNNDKVWRIAISDKYILDDAINIRLRFNKLIDQFDAKDNYTKYALFIENKKINPDEDIAYEMSINNKRYEAAYKQKLSPTEINDLYKDKRYRKKWLSKFYTETELDSLRNVSACTEDYEKEIYDKFIVTHAMIDLLLSNNSVWFMITESHGKYGIVMYYDNDFNKPNGEDL